MKKRQVFCFILLFAVFFPGLYAQSVSADMSSTQFDTSSFPQWVRDLRRAEIIAFGSFPFTYLLTNISYDCYRLASHNGDRLYAPWPVKGAGAIEQNKSEKIGVIGIAAGGAVLISLIDYAIVRYKRNRQEKESLPAGTPIIIRTPQNVSEPDNNSGNAPAPENP